jgi:hypothetical protein
MEYTVVCLYNIENFIREVNKYIADGWIPQGGVGCVGGAYMQAMIRSK